MAAEAMTKPRRSGRGFGQTLVVGLTGSIGMGKSTVATWFKELGVPVDDADAVVHKLYASGGAAVPGVHALFGDAVLSEDGGISRPALSKFVVGPGNAENLLKVEAIVFPLVDAARDSFISDANRRGEALVVLDIPLLFERGGEQLCDLVTVASAPAAAQRERVMARPGMTEEKFQGILAKQTPDAEKRAKSDVVFDTGVSQEQTKGQVTAFVADCREKVARERRQRQCGRRLGWAAALIVGAVVAGRVANRRLR
mmetsp:Transcript_47989/g.114053  ORF Transcript_47989/g.114053 Transcript_47989/m.114053 type:complete len:255 (-) Transcript_47989:2-766(-)